jgi:hypothetical protein
MSDTIVLCMLEGKLHALCAVAGVSNDKHQVCEDYPRAPLVFATTALKSISIFLQTLQQQLLIPASPGSV